MHFAYFSGYVGMENRWIGVFNVMGWHYTVPWRLYYTVVSGKHNSLRSLKLVYDVTTDWNADFRPMAHTVEQRISEQLLLV